MDYKLCIPLLFVLVSCSETKPTNQGVTTIDLKEIIVAEATRQSLSESEFVRSIPLETTDESLISYILEIKEDNECFYISSKDRLLVFDHTGKFIQRISRQGEGPDEYTRLSYFDVQNDTIYLFDLNVKRIMKFKKDGNLVGSTQLPPRRISNIFLTQAGDYIGYNSNIDGSQPIKLSFFDAEGRLTDSIPHTSQFDMPDIVTVFYDEGKFFNYQGKTFFKEFFNDTIYQVGNGARKAHIALDLGKMGTKDEGEARSKFEITDSWFKDMARVNVAGETEQFLFIYSKGLIVYDKARKDAQKIDLRFEDSPLYGYRLSEDGRYLMAHYTVQESDDNPVLVLIEIDKTFIK